MSDDAHTPATGKHVSLGDDEMINAVNNLSERVETLTRELTVSKQQARRTRVLSIAVIVMIVGGMVIGWDYARRISNNVDANRETQVQQCENANSVRQSNILLWEQVLGLSASSNEGEATPAEIAALVALQDWITVLYRDRDCNDLDRVYENPPPPDFSKIMGAGRE
jgi:hypothetical protein